MKIVSLLILALYSLSTSMYAEIVWSPPSSISIGLTNASTPRVVIDANGNATAAWIENNIITVSYLQFEGTWNPPTALSDSPNIASNPRLGVDNNGNATVPWIENTEIKSTVIPTGGNTSGLTISTLSNTGATNPTVAVDTAGNAVAVWVRSGFIESSTRISGNWSAASVRSAANSDNPHVAINNSGNAAAVWHTIVAGNDTIVTNTLTISGNTWGTAKNVFNVTAAIQHNYPKISIDANGNATVAWFRYNLLNGNAYQNVQVLSSSLTAGAPSWGIPSILSGNGIRNPADLTIKLRFDAYGNILAVWTNSSDGETFSIQSSRKLSGGSWPLYILLQVPNLYSFGIDVAIASGVVLMTSMNWDETSFIQIQSQESDATNPAMQGWTKPQIFSAGNNNGYPQCALSTTVNTLNAVAVWLRFDGTNNVVQASTGQDSLISPPSNLSVVQNMINFGTYQDFANTITWNASLETNLMQYNIYRNGIQFASTNPSVQQFVDHNGIQGGTVTYGIAAMTFDNRQSEIVSFTLNP